MFLILGICSIIKPLEFKRETRLIENPITIFVTILLFIFCINGKNELQNIITKSEGIILLGLCILFIIYNIIMAKKGENFDAKDGKKIEEEPEEKNIFKAIFDVIVRNNRTKIWWRFGCKFLCCNCKIIWCK